MWPTPSPGLASAFISFSLAHGTEHNGTCYFKRLLPLLVVLPCHDGLYPSPASQNHSFLPPLALVRSFDRPMRKGMNAVSLSSPSPPSWWWVHPCPLRGDIHMSSQSHRELVTSYILTPSPLKSPRVFIFNSSGSFLMCLSLLLAHQISAV